VKWSQKKRTKKEEEEKTEQRDIRHRNGLCQEWFLSYSEGPNITPFKRPKIKKRRGGFGGGKKS
jgi:hypothetical protein